MDIVQRESGEISILELSGELRGGVEDTTRFKGHISSLIEGGRTKVLLNFREVKWINSTGLGFLVAAYSDLNKAGGVLKMAEANERIMNIFMTTRFHLVIGIFATEDEALADFRN